MIISWLQLKSFVRYMERESKEESTMKDKRDGRNKKKGVGDRSTKNQNI